MPIVHVDICRLGSLNEFDAKVTRSTLQNAASVTALLLTTEALVAEQPADAAAMPGGGHEGGDGGTNF